MTSGGTSSDEAKSAGEREPEVPFEPHPGPPELQHLLLRMQSTEDQAGTGGPSSPKNEPEMDLRLMYTTTFLQLVLIPAILFGPVLSYPSNAIACFSSGGLALILGYLELQNRQRGFAILSFGIGLFLLISGFGRWVIGSNQTL